MLKCSSTIQTLVTNKAVKNYKPAAITSAVKEYGKNALELGDSIEYLRRKEVANIRYKIQGPMNVHLIGNASLRVDISETLSYLEGQGYYAEYYHVSQRSEGGKVKHTKGVVFMNPRQIEKLQCHGWLTLMDSTHKTNKHDWKLFTLYIRDNHRCWESGSHFFVCTEDSLTITKALQLIRSKCRRWTPRHILIDQSSTEVNSIKQAFPSSSAGEQRCDILFCIVHLLRT